MKVLNSLDYYLLRTPVLPIENSFDFIEGKDNLESQNFIHKISEPFIRNAFFLASPDFTDALDKYIESGKPFSVDDKIIKSFYKYFIRMSSRCTPFGLFAGCALGEFSESTQVEFKSDKYKTISRLDMYYVSALSEYLNKIPKIKKQLTFFPNETLYQIGNDFRYVEFSTFKSSRKYMLSSFRGNEIIKDLLQFAKEGVPYPELIAFLRNKDFNEDETIKFVDNLIDSQILVSDLLPSITGEEYFSILIKRLKELESTDQIVSDLEVVNDIVKSGSWTEDLSLKVKGILGKYVPTNAKNIVQTDLFFNARKNTISADVIGEIGGLVDDCINLQDFATPFTLSQFIRKFEAKYGDQEVPLLVALDNENGIGYNVADPGTTSYMPLLDNIEVLQNRSLNNITWGADKDHALNLILDAIQDEKEVVDLQKSGLAKAKTEKKFKLPDSMFLFGNLLANSTKDLDEGRFQFLLNAISGPSGANLLSRFCHGDEKLESTVKETLLKEENLHPEEIFAEVVHLPDGRAGNVVMRPTVRSYEIAILTKPSVEDDFIIKLNDLSVSITKGEVILRSKKLNKRIIPRLTNAHNYSRGLPVYRFLCDLQNQGFNNLNFWNWSVFKNQPFLPRIQFGKIILNRATWNFKKKEFLEATKKESPFEYFNALKRKYKIPDKVALVEGDNELLLSMSSQLSLNILADKLKKRNVEIQEYLFTPENCFIKDRKGSYTNELVVPFITNNKNQQLAKQAYSTPYIDENVKRNFNVGEPWLYFKIFTGNKTADRILVEAIKPLAETFLIDGVIEKWFFIRYDEHGHHLRIRFYHSSSAKFWTTVIDKMNELLLPFQESGLIYKVQIDTYQREIERYGNSTIELSESLFFFDSLAITEFLELIEGDKGEEYRWLFALLNIDRLLDDFGLTLYEKFQLISQLREYFYQEANKGSSSKKLWISLNNGYRNNAKAIYEILEKGTNKREDVSEAVDCFKRRSERNKLIVKDIVRILNDPHNRDQISLSSFLSSHIHMTLNRTFIAKQRIHETVIYHFLAKFYDSKISREENISRKSNEKITA